MLRLSFSSLISFSLLFVAIIISSCGKKDAPAPVAKDFAKVSFIHAAVNAPGIDVIMGGLKRNTDSITYGKGITYADVEVAGKKIPVQINIARNGSKVYFDSLLFNKNLNYTLYAYQDSTAGNPLILSLTSDVLAPPSPGKAKVRVFHLVPDASKNNFAPTIDVQLPPTGTRPTTTPQFTGLRFKNLSQPFLELDNMNRDIVVRVGGTTNVITNINNIEMKAGKIYTIVLRGLAFDNGARGFSASVFVNN